MWEKDNKKREKNKKTNAITKKKSIKKMYESSCIERNNRLKIGEKNPRMREGKLNKRKIRR